MMRSRRRHAGPPPACRECGHRVRFYRDALTGSWRMMNARPVGNYPRGAQVLWNGRVWDPLDLEAELSARPRVPKDFDAHDEVRALEWLTRHTCAVAADIASRAR